MKIMQNKENILKRSNASAYRMATEYALRLRICTTGAKTYFSIVKSLNYFLNLLNKPSLFKGLGHSKILKQLKLFFRSKGALRCLFTFSKKCRRNAVHLPFWIKLLFINYFLKVH